MLDKSAGQFSSVPGYAVIVFDENINDKEFCDMLAMAHIKKIFSASNQTALLNEFSEIKEIPLSEYFKRIEPFDPRNDGYAEMARALFVLQGKQRIFIPVSDLGLSPKEKIDSALKNAPPYKVIFQNSSHNRMSAIIIFLCAYLTAVFLAGKNIKKTNDKFLIYYIVFFFPSFAVLARNGTAGIAACAVFTAVFQILRGGAHRILTRFYYENHAQDTKFKTFTERLTAELRFETPKFVLLAALYTLICIISGISVLSSVCAPLCFLAAFSAALFTESVRGHLMNHIRFTFVPISPRKYSEKKIPVLPAPFLCAAFVCAVVSLTGVTGEPQPAAPEFLNKTTQIPIKQDYEKHIEFQKNFSYRRLFDSSGDQSEKDKKNSGAEYFHYTIGENKLITSQTTGETSGLDFPDSANFGEARPWTLKPLAAFLTGTPDSARLTPRLPPAAELVSVFLAVCLYVPFIVTRHRKKLPYLIYN